MPNNNITSFFSNEDAPWERLISRVFLGFHYAAMVVLLLMMVVTVVHGIGRYAFNTPIYGLVEMSQFMLTIIIFLTAAYTEVVKGHISIGIVTDRFSKRTQAIIDSATYIFSLIIIIVACWQTIVLGMDFVESTRRSALLYVPHFPFAFIAALAWLMLGIAVLLHLIHYIARAARRARQ